MARRRLPMHFIEDDRRRKATFMKRMPVIKKKAMELSKLCGIKVLLICNGNNPAGGACGVDNIETWPETQSEVLRIIQQYYMVSPEDRDRRMLNQKTHIQTQLKKMSVEIEKLRKSNFDGQYHMFRNSLVPIRALEDKLEAVNARINDLSANSEQEINNQAVVHCDDTDLFSLCFDPQAGGCNNDLDSITGSNYCVSSDHNRMHQDYDERLANNYEESMMEESPDHLISTPVALRVDYSNMNLRHNSMFGNNSFELHNEFNPDIMVRNNIPPPLLPHTCVYDHLKNRSNWNIGGYNSLVYSAHDCPFQLPWQYQYQYQLYQYQHLQGSTTDQTSANEHGKQQKLGFTSTKML